MYQMLPNHFCFQITIITIVTIILYILKEHEHVERARNISSPRQINSQTRIKKRKMRVFSLLKIAKNH